MCLCPSQYLAHISICSILNRYLLNSYYEPGTGKSQTNSTSWTTVVVSVLSAGMSSLAQSSGIQGDVQWQRWYSSMANLSFFFFVVVSYMAHISFSTISVFERKEQFLLSFENDETLIFKSLSMQGCWYEISQYHIW